MVFLLIQGRICFFFIVALRIPVKCSSIRLLKELEWLILSMGEGISQGQRKTGFIAFVVVLFEWCLKQNKKFLNIIAKLLQRIKDYHSTCPPSSLPPHFDFRVLSDDAFGHGGYQLVAIISALYLVFEIGFSENAFN